MLFLIDLISEVFHNLEYLSSINSIYKYVHNSQECLEEGWLGLPYSDLSKMVIKSDLQSKWLIFKAADFWSLKCPAYQLTIFFEQETRSCGQTEENVEALESV